ncbi:protein kinase [Blautia glucerasea]|uniref:serine/threonine protein kinase n=1 Tax=Blautia TaxID=572511 RepID=UPI00156EB9A5|nr:MULTISPECIES: serine/threonine-protein kinase [Blautia]MCB5548236.1 protein kinase [Blautia sp. MSK17_66]MCB6370951.1 protein kinase [Blautia glucerasea]NSK00027.1 protein kinase [Blautia obeum]
MDKQLPVSAWPEWKIVEKIGEGSFGKVYKARRTEQGKTFYSAIKVITIPSNAGELSSVRSENPDEQSVKEYFYSLVEECIQEVNTMEYFRGNSHVVSVEDYKVMEYLDDIGWDIYIRMEYLTSFLDYCAGRALTEEDVIHLGIDLCKALEYCQCQNIIHRDIKPENIFVSRFGEFKLGDFGIARELDRTMSGLSKKGTFSYMAPEMYRGEAYDARVDIYSLGIVLYKLRNHNRLPFISLKKQLITYRDKEEALNRRMAGEKLPVPAEAGEAFAEVILKACAYDRHDRYESAEEFRMALEQILYPGQPEMQEIRKPAITPDFEGSGKIFPEQEEEPEGTRVLKRTDPKARIHGEYSSKNRKSTKRKKKFEPLFAAAVIMVIAVCIVVSVFIWLLKENAELQKLKQSVTETVQSAENKQLQETLEKIQSQATEISDNLNDYSWIGSEDEGKISYLRQKDDGSWQVMKILIYPSLSQDGYYQEYYYWNNELFFAYIWADNNTMSDLKDGEQKIDRYYYEDGKLIRWIDDKNRCHDNETDSEEYVTRGEKYWDYADEYKTQLNLSDDSTSAS